VPFISSPKAVQLTAWRGLIVTMATSTIGPALFSWNEMVRDGSVAQLPRRGVGPWLTTVTYYSQRSTLKWKLFGWEVLHQKCGTFLELCYSVAGSLLALFAFPGGFVLHDLVQVPHSDLTLCDPHRAQFLRCYT
jgi:hypothetical protein